MMARLARIGIASGLAAALTAFVFLDRYRPWHLQWGATEEEVRRTLPGDEVVADPTFNATRAITVEAAPEDIWPWIVQMGFRARRLVQLRPSGQPRPPQREADHPFPPECAGG
jgi:hypothetical protein